MTGAQVISAGAFSMAGRIREPKVSRVVANLWRRLTREPDVGGATTAARWRGGLRLWDPHTRGYVKEVGR